jgi:NADH-quinone oxidoreductase subunit C
MTPLNLQKIQSVLSETAGLDCPLRHEVQQETGIEIPPESLRRSIEALIKRLSVRHLSAITVQQDPAHPETLLVYYHFWEGMGFHLAMRLPGDPPTLQSIIDLIPGADFYEREASEMFGIRFLGRQTTPPLLLPEGWQGAPPMLSGKED